MEDDSQLRRQITQATCEKESARTEIEARILALNVLLILHRARARTSIHTIRTERGLGAPPEPGALNATFAPV
eukprot:2018660-Amphidinium_carterae.1